MTQLAPAAMALAMSPEKRMPPSAMSGTPVPARASATLVDGRDLRNADAGDDAGRADRARADADLDGVGAGVNERACGGGRGDVAADHLQVGVVLLHPSHAVKHALAVAVGGVDDDDVHARFNEKLKALFGALAHADRGAGKKLAVLVLGGERMFGRLDDVLDGDQAREVEVVGRRRARARGGSHASGAWLPQGLRLPGR